MNPEKRYGLIIPKKDATEKKKPTISSVFGNDSSDSDKDISTDWKKKAFQAEAKKGIKRQTKLEMERALADDPTVYQYDEIYDEIDKKKIDKVAAKKKEDKKPRYIQSLLKQAERRKQEKERRNEREVQKEREKEGAEFGDKETFVTSSYRKKLEEFKKIDEEERRMDMLEEIGDVSKQQDLGGFYRHLYQTTVAEDDSKDKVYKKPEFSPSDKKSKDKIPEEELENSKVPNQSTEVDRKTQEKTSRSYRKRKKSESSDEEEVEKESKKNKVDKKRRSKETPEKRKEKKNKEEESKQKLEKEENPGADTSNSSSSEDDDDGSEEGEIIDKEDKKAKRQEKKSKPNTKEEEPPVELNLEDKVKSSLDKILEEKKKHLEQLIKEEEDKENLEKEKEEAEEKKEEKKEKKKINIWEKRTVGEVFDAALQRYRERKANREAMKG